MLYRKISSEEDSRHLQQDLDALQMWEQDWLMKFNPDKCQVLHITNKRKCVQSSYYIHGLQLTTADTAKYLGVHLNNTLNWSHHISTVTKKPTELVPSCRETSDLAQGRLRLYVTLHLYVRSWSMPVQYGILTPGKTSINWR